MPPRDWGIANNIKIDIILLLSQVICFFNSASTESEVSYAIDQAMEFIENYKKED